MFDFAGPHGRLVREIKLKLLHCPSADLLQFEVGILWFVPEEVDTRRGCRANAFASAFGFVLDMRVSTFGQQTKGSLLR